MTTNVHVSFPGLGMEKGFDINPVAFSVSGFDIRWYAIIICAGIVAAFMYFYHRARRTELIPEDDIFNITLFTVPIAIIGARFLYVITSLDKYDTFYDMINIRNGGLAIYGAIIFGGIVVLVYTLIKRISTLSVLDALSPAVMIGQVIGRWGNFMNGEAFGSSEHVANIPWRMVLDNTYANGTHMKCITHPTFLYESLWNLLGLILLNIIYKRKKFDGQIFFLYVAWYGFGRAFIEMLRTDSLRVFGYKLMVILGFLSCAAAVVAYIIVRKKSVAKIDEVDDFMLDKHQTGGDGNDNA